MRFYNKTIQAKLVIFWKLLRDMALITHTVDAQIEIHHSTVYYSWKVKQSLCHNIKNGFFNDSEFFSSKGLLEGWDHKYNQKDSNIHFKEIY